jgi:hypothetical protein
MKWLGAIVVLHEYQYERLVQIARDNALTNAYQGDEELE